MKNKLKNALIDAAFLVLKKKNVLFIEIKNFCSTDRAWRLDAGRLLL